MSSILTIKKFFPILLIVGIFVFGFDISNVAAATCTFNGTGTVAWSTRTWTSCTGGGAPQSGDRISIATNQILNYDVAGTTTISGITLASPTGTTTPNGLTVSAGTLVMTATGTTSTTAGLFFTANATANLQTVTMAGGNLTTGSIIIPAATSTAGSKVVCSTSGDISVSGAVNLTSGSTSGNGNSVIDLSGGSCSLTVGTSALVVGTTTASRPLAQIKMGTGTFTANGNVSIGSTNSVNAQFITSNGTSIVLNGASTVSVGGASVTVTIASTTSISKTGSGTATWPRAATTWSSCSVSGGTLTFSAAQTCAGVTISNGATLAMGANLLTNSGNLSCSGSGATISGSGGITLSGASATISGDSTNTCTVSNSGTFTINGTTAPTFDSTARMSIAGAMTLAVNAPLTVNGTVSVGGNLTIPAITTSSKSPLTIGSAANFTVTGTTSFTLAAAALTSTIDVGAGTATFGGTLTMNGSTTSSIGKINLTSGTLSFNAGINTGGTTSATAADHVIDISGGAGTVNFKGDIQTGNSLSGSGWTFTNTTCNGNTFKFIDTAAAQRVSMPGSGGYCDLVVVNTVGPTIMNNTITTSSVKGNITFGDDTNAMTVYTQFGVTGNSGKTFTLNNLVTYQTNASTDLMPTGFTLVFDPNSTFEIQPTNSFTFSSGKTFSNLSIKPSTAGLTTTIPASVTINGALTIGNGTNAVTVTADTNDPTLTIGGSFTINNAGTFLASNSVPMTIMGDMTLGTGTSGVFTENGGPVILNGNLTIGAGATFNDHSLSTLVFSGGTTQTITDNTVTKQDLGHVASSADLNDYLVDFGRSDQTSTSNWNNFNDPRTGSAVALVNTSGAAAGPTLQITNAFYYDASDCGGDLNVCSNNNGTTASTLYPSSATDDSFFLGTVTSTDNSAQLVVGGLNNNYTYDFKFYASRTAGDSANRTTDYTIGSTTVSLNTTDNIDGYVTIGEVSPTSGSITISIAKNASATFGYLGVLEITEHIATGAPTVVSTATDTTVTTLEIGSGTTWNISNDTMTLTGTSGTLVTNAGGTFTSTGSTVSVTGVGTKIIGSGGAAYNNLSIAASSTGNNLGEDLTVTGALSIGSGGDLDFNGYDVTVTGGITNAGTLTMGGNANPAGYYRPITINHTFVPDTDQFNFPVLISDTFNGTGGEPDLRRTSSGGKVQNANGYDIQFFADPGLNVRLDWEVEKYTSTTGELIAWVQVPRVSHLVDTVIYMGYGDSSISTFQGNASSVWDSNYRAVYHLPNGSSLSGADSSGNGNNGTVTSVSATTGQIDGGANFNGGGGHIDKSGFSLGSSNLTVSAWVYSTNFAASQAFVQKDPVNGDWEFMIETSSGCGSETTAGLKIRTNGCGLSSPYYPSNSLWHYLVATVNGTAGVLYIDGARVSNGVVSTIANTTANLGIGRLSSPGYPVNGKMDEVRVSNIARSPDWVMTEYFNQDSPTAFSTIGAETVLASTTPVVSTGGDWTNTGTYTDGTETLKLTYAGASNTTFAGGNATYNNVWFAHGSGTGSLTVSGDNTFNDFKDDGTGTHTIKFTSGSTQHFSSWSVVGTAGHQITIDSTDTDTHTLVKDGSGSVNADYLNIQHSIATPRGQWFAGDNSTDNNSIATAGSGWSFKLERVFRGGGGGGGGESQSGASVPTTGGTGVNGGSGGGGESQNGGGTPTTGGGSNTGGGGDSGFIFRYRLLATILTPILGNSVYWYL